MNIIKKNLIYLDLGDNGVGYNLPKMEDLSKMIEDKMNFIRSNGFQSGPIQLVVRNHMANR